VDGYAATVIGQRTWLAVEYGLLFFVAVSLYAWTGSHGSPLIPLVVLAAAAFVYLRRKPGFDRRNLGRPEAIRPQLRSILTLWTVGAVVLLIIVVLFVPDQIFDLPLRNPLLWIAVLIFYPLVSVYPQEVIFRAFIAERYAPLFGRGRGMALASAVPFGFVHIIFGNWFAVVLSFIGGLLFFRRYQASRSLLAAAVEHSLYGQLVFTIGLGIYFYHGAHLT
jgi:membrane protease YdiL (CAAX protease family)